ncbi:MAG: MBL fold metallo-hydrolase [Pseudomonadota bacterium]
MTITNTETGTSIHEIARNIFRISTPIPANPALPAGFSFNQFLIAAEEPLLFHTGPRKLFPLVREAISAVLPPETLRYVGFSHVEGDESGALAEWLALAPRAQPVCSQVAAMIFAADATDRPVRALAHGESIDLGGHRVTWLDTPHVPHGWECGYLGELSTRTLLCGDLFTQAGASNPPLTEQDILGPSEAMRSQMDYYAHGKDTQKHLERLAAFEPRVLACMHGSSFAGDGRAALLGLAASLAA